MGGFGLKVGGKMAGRGSSKGDVGSFNAMFSLSFASRIQENWPNNEPASALPRLHMMMHNVFHRSTVQYLSECVRLYPPSAYSQ